MFVIVCARDAIENAARVVCMAWGGGGVGGAKGAIEFQCQHWRLDGGARGTADRPNTSVDIFVHLVARRHFRFAHL